MKHSIRSISDASGVSIIGNVGYLSNKPLHHGQLGKLAKQLLTADWFHRATQGIARTLSPEGGWRSGKMALECLKLSMIPKRRSGSTIDADDPFRNIRAEQEPEWMKRLPPSMQREMRQHYALGEGIEQLAIVNEFPHMGFGYILPDDGMAAEAARIFRLGRLNKVKQLSFLHNPIGKQMNRSIGSFMFPHTRYCHSMDVLAVANAIGHNIRLRESDLNTLNTAAETHDALTPAGGDSVKLIDPSAFDEDLHYPQMLVGEGWENYRDKYRIDPGLLVKTINGEGLLGTVLNVADKSAYLARDAAAFLGVRNSRTQHADTGYESIARIIRDDPFVCAIWENARMHKGQLVFNDPERMSRFLTLRALMFRELYYNPYSRFFEYLVGKGVVKYLYQKGLVTRENLLLGTDEWIEDMVDKTLDAQFVLRSFHNLKNARIEEHLTYASAKRRMNQLYKDRSVIVILDDFKPVTSPSTKKFLVRKDGEVSTFHEACPSEARDIEQIMSFREIVRLYVFKADDLAISRRSRRKVKEILRSVA